MIWKEAPMSANHPERTEHTHMLLMIVFVDAIAAFWGINPCIRTPKAAAPSLHDEVLEE